VKGRPEEVTVDDLLPTYNNIVAFARPTSDGAWWLPLLEKAYAKVNNNYEMISSGKPSEAFMFLTGAPAKDFYTNTATIDELWAQLTVNLKKKHVITASCFNDYQGIQAGSGLIVKGFYSLRRGDGTMIRLLKLKYPWKNHEGNNFLYKGKFGPQDKSWTDEVKKIVNYQQLDKNEFFMTVEAFKYAFKNFMIGYKKPEY
jgi:hypothetical protein